MKMKVKTIVTVVAVLAVLAMAIGVAVSGVETAKTFWALVPPIVAIALALITKEVYSSLFLGIVVGAIFAGGGSFAKTVDHVTNDGLIGAAGGAVWMAPLEDGIRIFTVQNAEGWSIRPVGEPGITAG